MFGIAYKVLITLLLTGARGDVLFSYGSKADP